MTKKNLKKQLTTFQIDSGNKKRLITTYKKDPFGAALKQQHLEDLKLLEDKYDLDTNCIYAYLKNQSIQMLVNKHLVSTHFYQFDISKFFESIDHQKLLTKLDKTAIDFNQKLIFECSNGKNHGLSLGLVPSPYLSNIYLSDFDKQLTTTLLKFDDQLIYSRYSDDITISSKHQLDFTKIAEIVANLLSIENLTVNQKKSKYTHLSNKGQHLKVLGLNIICGESSNYITVGRKFKKNTAYEKSQKRKQAMEAYITYNER